MCNNLIHLDEPILFDPKRSRTFRIIMTTFFLLTILLFFYLLFIPYLLKKYTTC